MGLVGTAQAASLWLSPASKPVTSGDTVSFDVHVDFSDTATIGGRFQLSYDASLLRFSSFTYNSGFVSGLTTYTPTLSSGLINGLGFAGLVSTSGTLGTVTFSALKTGTASVTAGAYSDAFYRFRNSSGSSFVAVTYGSATEPDYGDSFNGVIPGEFGVSPTGAATYRIPIEVPPGIGGMTPQLSLNYNSQSGNGLIGVGWSLGGLSAITRCPATLAQDNGLIDPVDYDGNDRYCLDGQRLVSVTNTGCAGGTEYRTEIDSYVRVCAYGMAGTGPAWFKVWTKAGLVMEYANTVDSSIEAQGSATVLVWALNRIEDVAGNYLTATYSEDNANGEYRVDRIQYAGNDGQGMAPYHSVQFVYEARNDISKAYIVGKQVQMSVRLTNVQVNADQNTIRDYRLTYEDGPTSGHSRISSIEQCAGAVCLPATTLTWTAGAASFSGVLNTGRSNVGYQNAQPLDVNGDGKTDLAYCTSATTNWQILISTGSGLNAPINTGRLCTNYQYALPIDYNTDGKTDLLVPYANSRWYVLRSNGAGFALVDTGIPQSGYQNKPAVMDINGDGRDDLALAYNSAWYLRINNGSSFGGAVATGIASTNFAYRLKIDYDGDGRDDLLVPYASSRWYVLRSTGSTLQPVDTGRTNTGYNKNPQVMDVDGDGRQDLVVNGGTQKVIYFNRGNTLSGGVGTGVGTQWATTTFQLDYNGDGKMDLIMPGAPGSATATTWNILQSTGSGFTVIDTGIGSAGYVNYPKPGDYNGDGFVDLALAYNSVWMLRRHASGIADQLTAVDDGLSRANTFAYKPLTDASIYTATGSTYPQLSVRAPLYVVSSITTINGIGGSNTQTYSYTGGRVDLQGRGFLGFRTVAMVNAQTQIKNTTNYSQSFPYTGLVTAVDGRQVGAAAPLKTLGNGWSNVQPYVGVGVFQVQNGSTTETTYELDGSPVSTTVTSNSGFDDFNNPGQVTVTSQDGNGNPPHTKTTINIYDNDTVNWRLARLTNASVSSATPSGTQTRTSAFEYDPATGLLTAEIIEPGDPQSLLRTEYAYDGFGNKTSVTVKDSGSNAYPIATTTSSTNADYSQLAMTGTYTITNTNAKLQSETQIIDARFGVPLSLNGPNGLPTSWEYDSFGRKTKEMRADGTYTTRQSFWCGAVCASEAVNSVYRTVETSSGSAAVMSYFDSLGREVHRRAEPLAGSAAVYVDTRYNDLGQVAQVSRPHFFGATALWADYEYDILGRVVKETRPDGGVVQTFYNGLTTRVQRTSTNDPYDQTVTRVTDIEGNLISATDEAHKTTSYTHDPFGNLTKVTDSAAVANITSMAYDLRGRKTSMDDPDMGHWEYKYDALGQLRWQKDAKNQVATFVYDILGRMTQRIEPAGNSGWVYDGAPGQGIGKLWKATGPSYIERYSYDSLGRPSQTTHVMAGSTFDTYTSYDSLGRVDTLTYPSGFQLKHNYNVRGYLDMLINAANTAEVYWTAQTVSPDGQITNQLLGNGLTTIRGIDAASGRLLSVGTYNGINTVSTLNYTYDALGNLKTRQDAVRGLTETFAYDARNRLSTATISGVTKTWTYDDLGNIKTKDGYVDYTYGTAGNKPHAVTAARGQSYSYDANGNLTGGAGRVITWNSANFPTRITQGSAVTVFSYGPDRARYKQVSTVSGVITTMFYVGKLYEQSTVGTQNTYKNYIHAGGRVVAIRETINSGTPTTKYLHQDHLGSTDVITSSTGQVLERQSFDAFGTRRVATTWGASGTPITSPYSTRGYTGHEQVDPVGLIHMNGRVYDPDLGRFISADPTVQAPGNGQSLNRYSYTINNPLSMTDPSGYCWAGCFWQPKNWVDAAKDVGRKFDDEVLDDFLGVDAENDNLQPIATAVTIVVAPYAGFYIGTTFGLSTAAGYAISGATAGLIASGGDPRAALVGAATGAAFYGVGSLDWSAGPTALAHGAVGGASNVAMGGSFRDGFLSGGFTSLAAPTIGTVPGGAVGRTLAAAVVGGTASELGGGKFANGAVTFGYLQMFGEAANYYERSVGRPANLLPGENRPGATTYEFDRNGRQYSDSWNMNVFGNNDLTSFCRQGSACSNAMNMVPIANAGAGLHDYWFNAGIIKDFNFVTNYGTMPAAAAISTGAVLGNLTQGWDSNPDMLYYMTRP